MVNLTDFTGWVRNWLQDEAAVSFGAGEIETGLRLALSAYSQVSPEMSDSVITLSQPGWEVSLAALGEVNGVLEVWYPYAEGGQAPCILSGWRFWTSRGAPALLVSLPGRACPQAGDRLRIYYTKGHTIAGLDGATETTVPCEHHQLLAQGCAAFCAAAGTMDRSEVGSLAQMQKWGAAQLAEFNRKLDELRASQARSCGLPWGAGWKDEGRE